MSKQKSRSAEQQSRTSIQAAEAVALGTVAGGLALGAAQAREAQPIPEDELNVTAPDSDLQPSVDHKTQAEPTHEAARPVSEAAQEPVSSAVDHPASVEVQPDSPSLPEAARPSVETPIDLADAPAPAEQSQIVATDAPAVEQVSRAIEQLVSDVAKDGAADVSALPLAGQILESVAEIVSMLKPNLDILPLTSLSDTLQAKTEAALEPTKGLLQDLPETISSTVESVLTGADLGSVGGELADLPASITETVTVALGSSSIGNLGKAIDLDGLSSSLLGHDGPAQDTGLLSTLFYTDGESDVIAPKAFVGQSMDSLHIPELTQSASSLVSDVTDLGLGMLGVSYTDLSPDGFHPASGGIGGLGLL